MLIEDSRIGLKYTKAQNKIGVVCFLYNPYQQVNSPHRFNDHRIKIRV